MNEEKFLEELEKFGYEYELEHDEETRELLYVNIIPKHFQGLVESYRVESDIIDFMLDHGFVIDQIIFEDAITGVFVSFYKEGEWE